MFLKIAAYRETENSPLVCMSEGTYGNVIEATINFSATVIQQVLKQVPKERRKEVKEKLYNKYIQSLKETIEVQDYKIIKSEKKKKDEGEE